MNVTSVVPLKASVPGTVAPVEVSFSRMLVLLTVPAVTASLNVTVIGAVAETPLAPFAGVLDVTVGPSSSRVVHTDVNGAAVFLASAASDYVQGHILAVDGGWLAR